jgi:anti-sigma B factor antagonist
MSQAPQAIDLGPELTIVHAAQIREVLLTHLSEGHAELVLDLSGATDVDSSAVQILLATQHSLNAQGRSLRISGMSKTLKDVLTLYALQPLLDTHH